MKHFLYLFLAVVVLSSCEDNLNEVTSNTQNQITAPENLSLIAQENIQNKDSQLRYLQQQNRALSLSEDERNKTLSSTTNGFKITEGLAKIYNNTGNDYYREGNYEYALFYYLLSLDLKLPTNDNEGMALSYRNIALTYQTLGDYQNAAINFWQSYYLYEALENASNKAKLLNDLGIVYDLAHDFVNLAQFDVENSQSLLFYEQSIDLSQALNDYEAIAQTENNIGLYYNTYLSKSSNYTSRTDLPVSRDQEDVEDEL